MRADNSRHLAKAAAERKAASRERVVAVLRDLHASGETANVTEVARRAGVSRAYIYAQADVIAALRELNDANGGRKPGIPTNQRTTPASLLAKVENLLARNKQLREENQALRKQLEIAYGELRLAGGAPRNRTTG
ncbi:DUF6262 family protein [Sinomonas sp. ASV486]|uniref:DUF6262 family protein n=1 Tax=Sinomonas sp. ASV486 TaxID=3051170 RepID=UPI0027DD5784|nr:DUF6262 family protein [Sinomonas sp. ASV486]MDQ4490792.1 DUF6262 family protein [Sinomonas sp. ASV486]